MKTEIIVLQVSFLCLLLFKTGFSLSCPLCKEEECKEPLRCKGGVTKDACHCCTVCAKVEGEECGGPWNISGVCDKGLICSPKSDFEPGRCKNPNKRGKKRLPKCVAGRKYPKFYIGRFRARRFRRCPSIKTVFCEKCCKRCCEHTTTCNPDIYTYIPRNRCQRQERMSFPKRLQFGDVDGENDENEVEALESDIKS